jgi:hypothetical protein
MAPTKPSRKIVVVPQPAFRAPERPPPQNTAFNGVVKTDPQQVWPAKQNFPIAAISLSDSKTLEITPEQSFRFLTPGDFSFRFEGVLGVGLTTQLTYTGSTCPNFEYNQEFLTKECYPGEHPVVWTAIIRAQKGGILSLTTSEQCIVDGQLIINKL